MVNDFYIVALTGGIGSGKTEASNVFAELGIPIIDLDIIAHQLTAEKQPLVDTLAITFGDEYVTEEGALDREKMRQLVFSDEETRQQLNAILHPAIYVEAFKQLHDLDGTPYVILSIPLLEEDSQYLPSIDRVLMIDCDETIQIERVKLRSKLSEAEIKKIIRAQVPRQVRLRMSDDVIINSGNTGELRQKIMNLHQKYIKTCIVSKTIS